MHTKHLLGESLPLLAKGQAIALRRFLLAVYATGVGNFKHWSTDWCRSPNFPQSLVFGNYAILGVRTGEVSQNTVLRALPSSAIKMRPRSPPFHFENA
jgi:hypothetical protein